MNNIYIYISLLIFFTVNSLACAQYDANKKDITRLTLKEPIDYAKIAGLIQDNINIVSAHSPYEERLTSEIYTNKTGIYALDILKHLAQLEKDPAKLTVIEKALKKAAKFKDYSDTSRQYKTYLNYKNFNQAAPLIQRNIELRQELWPDEWRDYKNGLRAEVGYLHLIPWLNILNSLKNIETDPEKIAVIDQEILLEGKGRHLRTN